jgi:(4-(4-[2-(gamma-L-glutamylamino)ethyl]phenoxymethyl)furan-2-yl)methanamine synthase
MAEAAVIGWDVGGAHLKAAAVDRGGRVMAALQLPCTLWRGLDHLERALDQALEVLAAAGGPISHAATMTGELVDLFSDRRSGVRGIAAVLAARLGAGRLRLYAGEQGFCTAPEVDRHALAIASANWRASAELLASRIDQALLVDIGSTTTDLVPVRGGRIVARGGGDFERLVGAELVYSGVVRTPLMALAEAVPFEGLHVPLMAELFATTADVYRLTGELDERCDQHAAADGGAKTRAASAARLARMVGRDATDSKESAEPEQAIESAPTAGCSEPALAPWRRLAGAFREKQLHRIGQAAARVIADAKLAPAAPLIAAGSGAFLVPELARRPDRPPRGWADLLDADAACASDCGWMLSVCAPAVAVALLALRTRA